MIYGPHGGILRWMTELGRKYLITEALMLASDLVHPREGHFDTMVAHLYEYLQNKHSSRIV